MHSLRRISLVLTLILLAIPARANPDLGPISLTNSDGQALTFEKLDVRVAIHGCLSLTEMEMVFSNPQPREMEGRFLCILPSGATISRFAKEVNDKLMEGEVVERLKAQSIFNQILPTMRDPALLEHDQGNRFSVRVFPVPASGKIRLLLAYSRLLPLEGGVRKLTVPLTGTPPIGEFTFSIVGKLLPGESATSRILDKTQPIAGSLSSANFSAKAFTPQHDIELVLKGDATTAGESVRACTAGYFQMLCYRPDIPPPARPEPPRDWMLYVDTSASGAENEQLRLRTAGALAAKMQENKRALKAFAFDLDVAPLPSTGVIAALRTRRCLGATNLAQALKHIGDQARAARSPQCFVLLSDGIATAGPRDLRALLDALGAWPERHVLHALVLGSVLDETTLGAIVEKTAGRIVRAPAVEYPEESAAQWIAELSKPLGRTVEIQDEGVRWTYPRLFRDVQPGSELISFSSLRYVGCSKPKIVQRAGKASLGPAKALTFKPEPLSEFEPLLLREACRALLGRMEEEEGKEAKPERRALLHNARIDLSRSSRVLCPLTSLIVLETEHDYYRYEIGRYGLADVLAVGKNGIENKTLLDEETAARLKTLREAARKREDARADAERSIDEEKERLLKQVTEGSKVQDFGLDDNGLRPTESKQAKPAKPRTPPLTVAPMTFAEQSGIGTMQLRVPMMSHAFAAVAPGATPKPSSVTLEREIYLPSSPGAEWQDTATEDTAVPIPKDWHTLLSQPPGDADLEALRAKAAAAPRNRTHRNAFAQALERAGKWKELHALAQDWLPYDPQNTQVYEYLGTSAAKLNDLPAALRAFTSIGEIAPNRAALLARAGWLLLTVSKYDLAAEQFREAIKNRPDDCNFYRGLALCAWLQKDYKTAASVLEDALKRDFGTRGYDAQRALSQELGFVFRAMFADSKISADETARLKARAKAANVDLALSDTLRVTLCWETDATDVELFVVDPRGEECFSGAAEGHDKISSLLELYPTRMIGLGPKIIRTGKPIAGVSHVGVNYQRAGPMGISRGVVVILKAANGIAEPPAIVPFALVPALGSMYYICPVRIDEPKSAELK